MNDHVTAAEMDVIFDAYNCGYADSGQPQGLLLTVEPPDLHCDNCIFWLGWPIQKNKGECLLQFEKDSPISLSIRCSHSDHDDAAIITEARYGCTSAIARAQKGAGDGQALP